MPEPMNFDGWVVAFQAGPGAVLVNIVEALPTTDTAPCDAEHDTRRRAAYQLTNSEDAQILCQECVEDLYRNASTRPDYVIGAVPAN